MFYRYLYTTTIFYICQLIFYKNIYFLFLILLFRNFLFITLVFIYYQTFIKTFIHSYNDVEVKSLWPHNLTQTYPIIFFTYDPEKTESPGFWDFLSLFVRYIFYFPAYFTLLKLIRHPSRMIWRSSSVISPSFRVNSFSWPSFTRQALISVAFSWTAFLISGRNR